MKISVSQLPPVPAGKTGWPWTAAPVERDERMPNGAPWPRITVVTPSYNQGNYIEETIRSILLQDYPNLEYLVIDGRSTDESLAIIQRYSACLSGWISEPDSGQTSAINKGLRQATGDIFNWINSDDLLEPDALHRVAAASQGADMVAGCGLHVAEGKILKRVGNRNLSAENLLLGRATFFQQAMWYRRQALVDCGMLDESLHYAFDIELAVRYLANYPMVRYLPDLLARMRIHTAAKSSVASEQFHQERLLLAQTLGKRLTGHPELISLESTAMVVACFEYAYLLADNGDRTNAAALLRRAWRSSRIDALRYGFKWIYFVGILRVIFLYSGLGRLPINYWRSAKRIVRSVSGRARKS